MLDEPSTTKPKHTERVIVDDDGNELVLRGFGWALEYGPLTLDPRLDLTKPIWEQVQRLNRLDALQEKREQRQKARNSKAAA